MTEHIDPKAIKEELDKNPILGGPAPYTVKVRGYTVYIVDADLEGWTAIREAYQKNLRSGEAVAVISEPEYVGDIHPFFNHK